jgi:P-type Cu+ transporter
MTTAAPVTVDSAAPATAHLHVTGMTCGSCVRRVERALRVNPAVKDVVISLETGETTIAHDGSLSPPVLAAMVVGAGYSAVPVTTA